MPNAIKTEAVQDRIAEKLESAGLWRRAAARWLAVMDRLEYSDGQREWIRLRRKYCQTSVALVVAEPERLNISAISKAANATQARMGLSRPRGAMFRTYPEGEEAAKCK